MAAVLERVAILRRERAAAYLSVGVRRLDDLRRSGAVRAVQEGNRWVYRIADLNDYIDGLPTNTD